jgi:hypothetical protein
VPLTYWGTSHINQQVISILRLIFRETPIVNPKQQILYHTNANMGNSKLQNRPQHANPYRHDTLGIPSPVRPTSKKSLNIIKALLSNPDRSNDDDPGYVVVWPGG